MANSQANNQSGRTQPKPNHDSSISCNSVDITNCIVLKRITSMLQFYHHNHNKYNEVSNYLEKYNENSNLIADYHHILDRHLNEDKISESKSNEQFETIHQQIANNLSCDISKCYIHSRNNRHRDTTNIDCQDDKHLSMFIDIMDTIHCYFIHSIDIGYRIIHTLDEDDKEDDNIDDTITDSIAYDVNMARIRKHLRLKRKKLESIRGRRFMTHLTTKSKFMTHIENQKEEAPKELTKQGYLNKQGQSFPYGWKNRYIILKENHLFCYKDENKSKITTFINLSIFKKAQFYKKSKTQFELIPNNSNDKKRIFAAKVSNEAVEWIKIINESMVISNNAPSLQSHKSSDQIYTSDDVEYEEKKNDIEDELRKEGYLKKQSLYFKQLKKRYIILKDNHLYCYTDDKKTEITELIDLSLFTKAKFEHFIDNSTQLKLITQFELVPQNENDYTRIFSAESREEADEWIQMINVSMNVSQDSISIGRRRSRDAFAMSNSNSNQISMEAVNDQDEKKEMETSGNIEDELVLRKEGYLKQEEGILIMKQFKKRYIILRDNHLYVYTDEKKTEIKEHPIDLSLFTKAQYSRKIVTGLQHLIDKSTQLNIITQFELIPHNEKDKTRIFFAESREEADEWIEIINVSIDCINPTKLLPGETDVNVVDNEVIIEGYLLHRSSKENDLRKVFVSLKDNYLYCYDNDKKTQQLQKFHLKSYTKAQISQMEVGYFELISYNRTSKTEIFVTDTMDQLEQWVNNINKCIFIESQENDEEKSKTDETVFNFGQRRDYYWNGDTGKYESIKEELISNKIYPMDKPRFDDAYNKAQYLIRYSPIVKALKTDKFAYKQFNVAPHTPIKVENILSVTLYTDYDTLSYRFSQTFRKITSNEKEQFTTKRNQEFWNWSKLLIETVNTFGTGIKQSTISAYYHGVSFMYFSSFVACFNSPTSATIKLQIACIFATDNGIIMQLGKSNYGYNYNVKYFNCSLVSCFPYEDERLFIQPYHACNNLNILTIRNMSTDENYKIYIEALNVLQKVTTGDVNNRFYTYESKQVSVQSIQVINQLIAIRTNTMNYQCPDYVKALMDKLFMNNMGNEKKVRIYLRTLKAFRIKINLYDSLHDDIIFVDKLNIMFKNAEKIILSQIENTSKTWWNELILRLERINKLSFSKLICITIYPFKNEIINDFEQYQSLCWNKGWKLHKKKDDRAKQNNRNCYELCKT